MDDLKTSIVPDAEELLRRLVEIDDEPYMRERFYPRLLKTAGRELTGQGIVMALMLAVADYTNELPPVVGSTMTMRAYVFLSAFTDDPRVLGDARGSLSAIGLPTD